MTVAVESAFEHVIGRFAQEAPSNRFLQYDPAEIAAGFLLPIAVTEWEYEPSLFYDIAVVEEERRKGNRLGYNKRTLKEEYRRAFSGGEPLRLRRDLIVLFLRGSLYPEDFACNSRRAERLSCEHPEAAIVLTTFERTDVLVGGRTVREYGLRDWDERFDELTAIFHAKRGRVPEPYPQEEQQQLRELVEEGYQRIEAIFQKKGVAQVFKRNPARTALQECAVQTLAYLLFLRACEETYPFERNLLRRFYWAYAGDGYEAYGDVSLAGDIWADINRVIRGMGADEVLPPYLDYKFPDGVLRRKLWSLIGRISNDEIHPVLGRLVTERLGLLRAIHLGPVLGRTLDRARGCASRGDGAPALYLLDGDEERQVTTDELKAFLDASYQERVRPAFEKGDVERAREVAEWSASLRVEERHDGGPILIAQAAEMLSQFFSRLRDDQIELEARIQQQTDSLFGAEQAGTLGPRFSMSRVADSEGPYHELFRRGILSGSYASRADAELAEICLNTLSVLQADRGARHPALLEETCLHGYYKEGYLIVRD